MKNGFKLVLITLPLAAIGAGILAYIVATKPPPAQETLTERATAVRVIVARNQPVSPTVTGFGLVIPARTYEAIAQVSGTVDYVNPNLRKGAILPAGSVLLRLSPVDFNLAIAQAQANIRAAEAKLSELAVSEENQTSALAIEANVLALKQGDLERTETLFNGGTVSQSALDAVRSGVLAQRQKVQAIKSTLALLPTQREVQVEQIAVYKASFETAALNLARSELTLPFSARVASAPIETGQYVRLGQTVSILDGIDMAEVEAQVSVSALRGLLQLTDPDAAMFATDPTLMTEVLHDLDLSAEVRLTLGQDKVRWPARVDRISDTIDPKTGTLGVIVQVDTAYTSAIPGDRPPLTKGMFVEVALNAALVEGIVIPRSALREGQVYVVDEESRLELVSLVPLLVQDGIVVITEGLYQGQQVVVSDPNPAMPGMLLDVTVDKGLIEHLISGGAAK